MVWFGGGGGGWFQFSLFISFLPIRRQNVPLLSVGAEVVGVEAAGGGVEGEGGTSRKEVVVVVGKGGVEMVEFTHHITTANRNPPSNRRYFHHRCQIRADPPRKRGGRGGLGRTIWAIYWHIGTG